MMYKGNSEGTKAGSAPVANVSATTFTPVTNLEVDGLAPAERSLAEDARNSGAPATAVNDLLAATEKLDTQSKACGALQSTRRRPRREDASGRDETHRHLGQCGICHGLAA